MTEHDPRLICGLRGASVEQLSPQAWQRVESGVFSRLDAAAVPWSLAPGPLHSYASPRPDRTLRLHWSTSFGLALASAAAAACVLHLVRPSPPLEAGPPAELVMPAPPTHPAWVTSVAVAQSPRSTEPEPPAAALPAVTPPVSPPPVSPPLTAVPPPALPVPQARSATRREAPERAVAHSDRERLFERAASLESANASLALALYLSLASDNDAWAANALYAAARLEIDRGLRDAGAEHLSEYLARFPNGENLIDVRGLRQRIGVEPR